MIGWFDGRWGGSWEMVEGGEGVSFQVGSKPGLEVVSTDVVCFVEFQVLIFL